jgi:PEP-CTERM motif
MRAIIATVSAIALPIMTLAAPPQAHADLIGTNVTYGSLFQQTSASMPVVLTTTATEPVVPGEVTFPSLRAYGLANNLGLFVVDGAVTVGPDSLTETFANAGSGPFASAFENDDVYTFESAALVNITGAVIDPISNLGLTDADLTFSGNQLFVNFGGGISYNPNSILKIDLVVQGGPRGSPVPEPSTWAMMLAGFVGLGLAGYRSTRRTAAIGVRP